MCMNTCFALAEIEGLLLASWSFSASIVDMQEWAGVEPEVDLIH